MKKILRLLLVGASLLLLSSCGGDGITAETEHTVHTYGEWEIIEEANCLREGLRVRKCTGCEAQESEVLEKTGHTEVIDAAVEATCTTDGLTEGSHCGVCGEVFVIQETIKGKHDRIKVEGYPATCTATGLSDGAVCSKCDKVYTEQKVLPIVHDFYRNKCKLCLTYVEDYSDLTLYNNIYGYEYLNQHTKAKACRAFYSAIDKRVTSFHDDATQDMDKFPVSYQAHGLSTNEAQMVYTLYQQDHPLYYWIDGAYSWDGTNIYVHVISAYTVGRLRVSYNQQIYEAMKKFGDLTRGETSQYKLALAYYEAIALQSEYSYDGKGEPVSSEWAHNILGFFTKEKHVCEGYAEVFSLLLNYSGVRNLVVVGYGDGGGHAWNLVRLDDRNWYWFDLTWDDTPDRTWGVSYQYFAVNDTESVVWGDAYKVGDHSYFYADRNFLTYHTPATYVAAYPEDSCYCTLYPYPARSRTDFSSDEILELRETFMVDGCTYSVVGYNKVQLISATIRTHLDIPETVEYDGVTYTVIAIGGVDQKGYFSANEYVISAAQKVTVPSTVIYVWGNALESPGIEEIVYAEDAIS